MLTAVPFFLTFFTYYVTMSVCFVHASFVNIMELEATVIQVNSLASYKTKFYPVRNMTVVIHSSDVFELLILPFN